jgi:O-antigen chain-terminating methyltransferase
MSGRIKNRIKSRLFNMQDNGTGSSPGNQSPLRYHPSDSTAMVKTIPTQRIRGFLENIPVIGYVIIWCWRFISLPPRFHRLSRHFESHVEESEAMKRVLTGQGNLIEQINQALQEMQVTRENDIHQLQQAIQEIQATRENDIHQLQQAIQELQVTHEESSRKADSITGQLRELNEIINGIQEPVSLPDTLTADIQPYLSPEEKKSSNQDIFYHNFEKIFRGSEHEIEKRQHMYFEYVWESSRHVSEGLYFLDAGCGRGEFLRILQEAGVRAKGVEINESEYSILKAKGFDVEHADINSYLGSMDSDSLVGISCFQVIEHFTQDYLKTFLDHAYRKIAPKGILIIETVNTKCTVALSNFFLDPSHVTPYPPELLKFLLEWYGFQKIRVLFSSPCAEHLRVKDAPEQNYLDVAVMGWKR